MKREFLPIHRSGLNRAAVLAILVIGAACEQHEADSPAELPPNIVYILADDLGYGDLGTYGQQTIRTPHLDRLAREGIRFTQHYAGSTVCAPSRCSLMTGLHTGHAYIRGNSEVTPMGQLPIPADTATLAEILQKAGYTTGLVGKWGLGGPGSVGHPNLQGFDLFFGYLCQRHAHNYFPEFLFRNEEREELEGNVVDNPRPDGAGQASARVTYSPDLMLQEALAFLDQHRQGPFFLFYASTLPHANNEAGDQGMEIPSYGVYANEDWPEPQKGHAAMISRLDQEVGAILQRILDLGIDNQTLVVFSSDNGPHREGGADPTFFQSSGPLRGIKRDLYEGGIRVPMLARWPGRILPGATTDHVSAFWDLLPTVAELAGVQAPDELDGISLLPSLLGRNQPQHDYLYWEFRTLQAVRLDHWKGIRKDHTSPLELYDLDIDPGETQDVADQHGEIVQRIEEIMFSAHQPSPDFPLPPEESKPGT